MLGSFPKKLRGSFRRSENMGLVILALGIGLTGGVGAVFFRYLIGWADQLFFEGGAQVLSFMDSWYVVVLPMVGLVIVSLVVRKWAPEAQGHGVPEVMYAVKKQGGRIRPRVAIIKAFASALCIGSGGSVGREGPIVQIGATIGSGLGQFLGLRQQRVRLLLACGAAAGVGGTFNAPIAGVIFSLEVILGSFAARSFGLVVISSVTSTALCQAVLGAEPAFPLAQVFALNSYYELPIYLALGLLAGIISLSYVQVLYFLEDLFERWNWHYVLKAALGGLAVGLVGWLGIKFLGGRYLFGVGYDGIEAALFLEQPAELTWALGAGLTIGALLLLTALKILATSLTLAAGGSGGVFAPALFIGATAGGAFGLLVNSLFPGVCAPPGAYALVGMGAVFAGSAHAPMTAVLILFEMTDDYKIIMPLMIAVVISYLLASGLHADSIYTIKLRRRGGLTPSKGPASALDLILVADAMTTDVPTVLPQTPLVDLAGRMHQSDVHGFPVLSEEGPLVGIVTKRDLGSALVAGIEKDAQAQDIMTHNLITCAPDEPLRLVLPRLTSMEVSQMPVVDPAEPDKLLGTIQRKQIFWAYGELASEHKRLLLEAGLGPNTEHEDSLQIELEVSSEHEELCFKKIREVTVPEQSLIVLLRRASSAIIPRGDTQIEPGDMLVFLTTRVGENRLRRWLGNLGK